LLEFLQDIVLVIPFSIITIIHSLVNCIPIPPLLHLEWLIKSIFIPEEEFPSGACTIDFYKMGYYNIPTTNCTSGPAKFLYDVIDLLDKPPEAKKRRSRYVIYKQIEVSYHGDRDEENGILEKFKWPMKEDMWARVLREW
jgi:hypothetical protein